MNEALQTQDVATGSQEAAPESADERLSRRATDELLIVDLITDASREVRLVTPDEVFELFEKKALGVEPPTQSELFEAADRGIDAAVGREAGGTSVVRIPKKAEREAHRETLPSTRAQREAFSRREMLTALLAGGTAALEAAAAEVEEPEEPERGLVTREYFDELLDEVVAKDCGVARFEAWDHTVYLHYRPLLSSSYARLMSAKNNPVEMVVAYVRDVSKTYPRPVLLGSLQDAPFNFTQEEVQDILKMIDGDENLKDIRFTTSSLGTVYLYSNKYLEDDYADYLAEYLDVGVAMSP